MSRRRRLRSKLTALRDYRLTPARYRQVCVVALALLIVIVVTGAAVRLTGSGLGCDDWPNCNVSTLIDVSSPHAAIEQINRLFTGFVAAGVAIAVLGAVRRAPRRRDLTWLSIGLVAGVLAQIVLGGITVLVDLHPAAVQGHLVVSMALVAMAVVLVRRAGLPDGPARAVTTTTIRRHTIVLSVATAVAVVLGTIVTGAGPHAGDREARRFDVAIPTAARIHSIAVWVAVAVALGLAYRLSRRPADRVPLDGALTAWVAVAIGQAVLGYIQYVNDIPAVLVGLHVTGATALWGITVWLVTLTTDRAPLTPGVASDGTSGEPVDELGALVDDGREEVADATDEVGGRLGAALRVAPER